MSRVRVSKESFRFISFLKNVDATQRSRWVVTALSSSPHSWLPARRR
jgi:hypothetical protein